jgi:hypothetical protein
MIKAALAAAGLALASPALAGSPAAARAKIAAARPEATGMISLSLIEALAALRQPQLAGIFSFVAEKDAPFAFADLLARDKDAMKLYLNKLGADIKAAGGLTEWDHEVCASLINLYSAPLPPGFVRADEKRMKQINECMLSQTMTLEEIVSKRKK